MNKKMIAAISFVGGVAVGMNWPKIRKCVDPLWGSVKTKSGAAYNSIVAYFARKKESFEDMLAASKISKKKKKSSTKKRAIRIRAIKKADVTPKKADVTPAVSD